MKWLTVKPTWIFWRSLGVGAHSSNRKFPNKLCRYFWDAKYQRWFFVLNLSKMVSTLRGYLERHKRVVFLLARVRSIFTPLKWLSDGRVFLSQLWLLKEQDPVKLWLNDAISLDKHGTVVVPERDLHCWPNGKVSAMFVTGISYFIEISKKLPGNLVANTAGGDTHS